MDVILLDEITNKIDELNSSLSSTINTINTNVNEVKGVVDVINAATAINNTASTTGTLSQKLSSIISTLSTVNSNITTLKSKNFCKITAGSTTSSITGPAFITGNGYNNTIIKLSNYSNNNTIGWSALYFLPSGETATVVNNGDSDNIIYYIKFSNN